MNRDKKNNCYKTQSFRVLLADFFIDHHRLSEYILAINHRLVLSTVRRFWHVVVNSSERGQNFMMGRSQVVRHRFLVSCIVGSNPTAPAKILLLHFYRYLSINQNLMYYECTRLILHLRIFSVNNIHG